MPYDAVNRNVLSLRLNSAVDWHSFNSVGSWFHRRGAATEKACSPIFSLGLLTVKSPWADARSADQEEISATGVRRSANHESNTWQMTYSSREISLTVYKCYWYRPFLSLASTARVIIFDHLPATASHQRQTAADNLQRLASYCVHSSNLLRSRCMTSSS